MKQITATIIMLGAVAGAITAIKQLRPARDPVDSASLSAIRITSQVPLNEYLQRLAAMSPHKFAGAMPPVPPVPPSVNSAATASATRPPASSTASSTAVSSSGPASSTATSTALRTTTTDRTSSTEPTTTNGPLELDGEGIVLPPWADRGFTNAVTTEVLKRDPQVCPTADTACRLVIVPMMGVASTDNKGNLVSPAVAAERVLQVLKDARRNPDSEPIGALVTVDVELSGLRGKTLLLSWSMWQVAGATRLHGDWLNTNLAYRLQPTTDLDTTTVDLWIPLPPVHGPYFVRVDLFHQGSRMTSGDSAPFE